MSRLDDKTKARMLLEGIPCQNWPCCESVATRWLPIGGDDYSFCDDCSSFDDVHGRIAARARAEERARIVAWLRALEPVDRQVLQAADAIERGEHLAEPSAAPRVTPEDWARAKEMATEVEAIGQRLGEVRVRLGLAEPSAKPAERRNAYPIERTCDHEWRAAIIPWPLPDHHTTTGPGVRCAKCSAVSKDLTLATPVTEAPDAV